MRVRKDGEARVPRAAGGDRLRADTGRAGDRATGRGIGWAVPDTGVRADRPHFATLQNVAAV